MDYEAGHNSPQLINHGQVGEAAPSAYRCMHRLSALPPVGGEGPDADALQAITPHQPEVWSLETTGFYTSWQ